MSDDKVKFFSHFAQRKSLDELPFATDSVVRKRAPVGPYLAATTQKPSAADRNNVCTTAAYGGVAHRLYRCSGQVE